MTPEDMKDLKSLVNRVFNSNDGKKLDELLRRICMVDASTTAVTNDPYMTYFNEGKRAVYQYLMKLKTGTMPTREDFNG